MPSKEKVKDIKPEPLGWGLPCLRQQISDILMKSKGRLVYQVTDEIMELIRDDLHEKRCIENIVEATEFLKERFKRKT